MKKIFIIPILLIFLFIMPLFSLGQQTSPGDPGEDPTGTGDPIGGGAPIGGGLVILLSLGAAYGGKKVYDMQKESLEE